MAGPTSNLLAFQPEPRPSSVDIRQPSGQGMSRNAGSVLAGRSESSQRALLVRERQELCAEFMLMLRLALGSRSPYAPLARGATSVRPTGGKDHEGSGLHILERLLMEFGDPSMGLAFVARVACYLAEPRTTCRTVPRLSLAGLRPSLQGLRLSLYGMLGGAVPRLSLGHLRPSLQGWPDLLGALTPASRSEASTESARSVSSSSNANVRRPPVAEAAASTEQRASGSTSNKSGGLAVVPHLSFVGLRPSLQGSSGLLGAPPSEEGSREARKSRRAAEQSSAASRHAAGSHRSRAEQCCHGWGSMPAASTSAVGPAGKEAGKPRTVPRLHLGGLPPSLQGCSGLGAPPAEEVSMSFSHSAVARPPQHPAPRAGRGIVPRLQLVGLRPSLQGWPGWVPPAATMCC
mmetsp:Transcript_120833/g.219728  ORF Transcript_120833/g.219728 Transcript_120833/m.219728 type:complete len:404 (+) Transcript_120833:125-1336(+)